MQGKEKAGCGGGREGFVCLNDPEAPDYQGTGAKHRGGGEQRAGRHGIFKRMVLSSGKTWIRTTQKARPRRAYIYVNWVSGILYRQKAEQIPFTKPT
jgi:hypothetical protein